MDTKEQIIDSDYKILYRAGGIAAFVMVLCIPIQAIIFFISPPPVTVIGWFTLFQKNAILGLLDMDLLLIFDQFLMSFIFLALYMLLRHVNKSLVTIALMLGLGGIVIYFSSAAAFEMLNLSHLYAVATTEIQKSIVLSAGQAIYSTWQGTAFNASYLIGGIATLLLSIVMLRSSTFNKTIAYIGIAMSMFMAIPPTVGMIGMIFAMVSLLPLTVWIILIGRRLLELSK
jgi:hypothetical protein